MKPPAEPCRLEILRAQVERGALRAAQVSAWSVGMHIEHCALAMSGIAAALLESTPPAPARGLALWQRAILLTGRIPRGKGRAPEPVVPRAERAPAELHALLDEAAAGLERVREDASGGWFEHRALGVMDRARSLRFLQVHNRHHVRIVADILAAAG